MKSHLITTLAALIAFSGITSAHSPADVLSVKAELDRSVLPADKEDTVYLKVGLYPERTVDDVERAPINVSIVIDRSSSMNGDRIVHAKAAAVEALRRLRKDDVVSIITYNNEASVLLPATRIGNKLEAIEEKINNINIGGTTAIYSGVNLAANELTRFASDFDLNRIILLSDGQANVGPRDPSDFARLGSELSGKGITVSSVGIGLGFNEDLMANLANSGEGNLYFVEHTRDLAEIFQSELGDITQLLAKDIEIEIKTKDGIVINRLLGRKGSVDLSEATVNINSLYASGERFAVIELKMSSQPAGKPVEIGEITVRFKDTLSDRSVTLTTEVTASISSDEKTVDNSANVAVQRAVADQIYVEANRVAVNHADKGNSAHAVALLNEAANQIQALNRITNDADIDARNVALQNNAVQIEANRGLSNRMRKQVVTDNYQISTQQSRSYFRSDSGNNNEPDKKKKAGSSSLFPSSVSQ